MASERTSSASLRLMAARNIVSQAERALIRGWLTIGWHDGSAHAMNGEDGSAEDG